MTKDMFNSLTDEDKKEVLLAVVQSTESLERHKVFNKAIYMFLVAAITLFACRYFDSVGFLWLSGLLIFGLV